MADELGDWTEFLYERAYTSEENLDKLLQGYDQIIAVRLAVPRTHECFRLNLRIETYDHRDFECMVIRRNRAEHFISAFGIQEKIVDRLGPQSPSIDRELLKQKARLAKIAVMTAGVVSGTDRLESNGIFGSDLTVRRRYDPEFYYVTSFRLTRQLERDLEKL